MGTTTVTKSAQRRSANGRGSEAKPAKIPKAPGTSGPLSGLEFEASIGLVDASPLNPRTHFDEAALKSLAESLKKHGQLNPILAWQPVPGRYEIIDGERRYRAAKLGRLPRIRLKVLDVTEEEAIELRGIANLEREDLTPIETARWYQQLMDRCGYTQTSLAKKIGKAQCEISQALALLKLPEDWQQRLITRVITPTHARFLVPWIERPQVLQAVGTRLKGTTAEKMPTVREFEDWIEKAVVQCTKPVYDTKITDQLRQKLDIIDLKSPYSTRHRAFNISEWGKRDRERKKRQEARSGAAAPRHKAAAAAAPTTPNQWDLQQQWCTWYVFAIAEKLEAGHGYGDGLPTKLLLWLFEDWRAHEAFDAALAAAAGEAQPERKHVGYFDAAELWQTLQAAPDMNALCLQLCLHILRAEGTLVDIDVEDVHLVASSFGIDPQRDWQPSTEFLELLSEDQLRKLPAKEFLSPDTLESLGKAGMMERLIEHWPDSAGIPKVLQLPVHEKG